MSLQQLTLRTRKTIRRMISHDNRYAMRLLFDTVRMRWHYAVGAVLLGVASAFFEGNTMGILTVAVSLLMEGNSESIISSLGPINELLMPLRESLSLEMLFVLLVGLGGLSQILRSLMDFGNQTVAAYLSVHVETKYQKLLFHQYLNISYDTFTKFKLGDIASLLNYTSDVGAFVRSFNQVVVTFLTVLFYLVILLWLSPTLLLLSVLLLFPAGVMMRRLMTSIRSSFKDAFSIRTQLNENITEYLQAGYLLRTYAREDYAKEQADKVLENGEKTLRKGFVWYSMNAPFFEGLSVLTICVFLIAVVFLVPSETISLPLIVAFIAVLWRLSRQATRLMSAFGLVNRYWAQVYRITDVLRKDNKVYPTSGDYVITSLNNDITFDNVTLAYHTDEVPALEKLNLTIPKGSMVALVGESGSGKSSTVSLLMRLYDPTDGAIHVDGRDLRTMDTKSWLQLIGFVSQDTFIFNDSIMNNIRFGRLDATDDDVINAARLANAHDFINSFQNGYQTIVGERGTRLSGGQRQRIALARALIRDVDILIFDEATSALDSESERIIQDTIHNLHGTRTIIAVAHRLSTIQQADNIIVLKQGHAVEQGTHQSLVADNGIYANLWNLQATSSSEG